MANPDYEFLEGFDIYGPATSDNIPTIVLPRMAQRWTSYASTQVVAHILAALSGTGYSFICGGSSASFLLTATLPGNYARVIVGATLSAALTGGTTGFTMYDGTTAQLYVGIATTGRIEVRRGSSTGTVIATSTESVTANSSHYVAVDVTFSAAAGIVKVWLDNVLTSINLTGQNTKISANAYYNAFAIDCPTGGAFLTIDHLFVWNYITAGGSELPPLDSPVIQTDFPTADSAVAFTPTAAVLGASGATYNSGSASNIAANSITLRPYVAETGGTLNSIAIVGSTANGAAKYKPVIYADSAGVPGSLMSTGPEIVGSPAGGVTATMPLTTPQAIVAGTKYWIGFLSDTNWPLGQSDTGSLAYRAANTYASGAPGTAPAMTSGQPSVVIYGNMTSPSAVNYTQVNDNPTLSALSYNASSTVGNEDLFTFPNLAIIPTTIYTVEVLGCVARSDTGARTIDFRAKSGATTASGSNPGVSPPTSFGWKGSQFKTDPNTGIAWAAAGVNAGKYGLKVAS